jgi:hypothetical protein
VKLTGSAYGEQATLNFPAPSVLAPARQETQAIDTGDALDVSLWRISALALQPTQRWAIRLMYGTASSLMLTNVEAPMVAYVPGHAQLYAVPVAQTADANLLVTLKPVSGYNLQHVRTIATAPAVVLQLPSTGVRFTALAASTVTVAGVAVALAAGQSIILAGPSTLAVGGSGIVEHEL